MIEVSFEEDEMLVAKAEMMAKVGDGVTFMEAYDRLYKEALDEKQRERERLKLEANRY